MANREISSKLASGEIAQIKVGGTTAGKIVQVADDLLPLSVEIGKNTVDIDNIQHGLGEVIPTPGHIRVKGANPAVELIAEPTSTAAQMQVVDKETGRMAASMEWFKATQEFVFTLFDTATGVAKAGFELKQDGKGYIGGSEILTSPHTDGEYKLVVTNGTATWTII